MTEERLIKKPSVDIKQVLKSFYVE